jgi:pyruvate dehydrogenase E1 component alpha subunit
MFMVGVFILKQEGMYFMYDQEQLKAFYENMVKIRLFEERVEKHFLAGEVPGFLHLYIGEEAIATGVCRNLTYQDYIASNHRGHGHTIAKGADLKGMMAEIFGKKTGLCKGKGGSMHIADFSIGMLGANGIVGGGYTLAVGAGLAEKIKGTTNISVVFFGDGASNRGTFHEAVNMAAVWKLPVLFVCENNQWAETTSYLTSTAVANIADRAAGYGIPGVVVNGNDVFEVYEAARELVKRARNGEGPALLECKTYRLKGHFVGDPERYRTREEVKKHLPNDPIMNFEKRALGEGLMKPETLEAIKMNVGKMVDEAVEFALQSPYPDATELFTDLYI